MLGLQIGSSWDETWKNPLLERTSCRRFDAQRFDAHRGDARRVEARPIAARRVESDFDEVCFFHTASRVAGAKIHDPFVVRRQDRVVAIGTGIRIKDVDDPVAEAVMRQFQTQIHARFQENGNGVWFVNLPEKPLSRSELEGFSKTAPVLLVQVGGRGRDLAVLYGYLAPVNAFIAAQSD